MRVNRVTVGDTEVRKERRHGAGLVIAGGNVYFRLAGALFRMFPTMGAWVKHETRMFQRLHHVELRRDGRAIVMPRLPGRDVLTLLSENPDTTLPLVAAGHALAALHDAGLSHGDCNLGNLLVDGEHARAIDFDAAHDERLPLSRRAADDVLGLVLDLLRLPGDFERRVAHLLDGYAEAPRIAEDFATLTRPSGFFAASLLRARAHGASTSEVERHLGLATSLLDRYSTSGRYSSNQRW